jgi:hypothetical protein
MRLALFSLVLLGCACTPPQLGRTCTSQADCGAGLSCIEVGEAHLADGGGSVFSSCTQECRQDSECTTRDSAGKERTGFCRSSPLNTTGKTWCLYSPPVE